jgi:hypothetical protein
LGGFDGLLGLHDGMPSFSNMRATASNEIKVVGKSGQISLGKSFAGKTLRLERRSGGTIVLTVVAVVPESQLWTTEEPHRTRIARGMAWAATRLPPRRPISTRWRRRRNARGSAPVPPRSNRVQLDLNSPVFQKGATARRLSWGRRSAGAPR